MFQLVEQCAEKIQFRHRITSESEADYCSRLIEPEIPFVNCAHIKVYRSTCDYTMHVLDGLCLGVPTSRVVLVVGAPPLRMAKWNRPNASKTCRTVAEFNKTAPRRRGVDAEK